jgi:hypothetical protein
VKKLLNPLEWPLAKSFFLIGFIVATTWVAYVPYTPGYDAHYSGQSFASASVRASYWLASCLVISYVLHTRRLVRTQNSGEIAHILLMFFYVVMLLVLACIWSTTTIAKSDGEPFFG